MLNKISPETASFFSVAVVTPPFLVCSTLFIPMDLIIPKENQILESNLVLIRFFATVSDKVFCMKYEVFGTYHIKVTKNILGMSQKP